MKEGSQVDPDLLVAELATRYLSRLRLFAARRLGDAAAAEDVAQETLRRVLEALRQGRVRDLQALPSYTFETARHLCQHAMRSRRRSDAALNDLIPGTSSGQPVDPLTALVSAERVTALRRALATLDSSDRDLIRMSFVDGLSADEIGESLGLTAGNVRVRRHRILRRLDELLTVMFTSGPEPLE